MLAPDVNVLVYAHRQELPEHTACKAWLDDTLGGEAAFGIFDLVLSGFIRVVTHPRVFKTPSPLDVAITFANGVRDHPNCVLVQPGPRHWAIFGRLCQATAARGNIVADAYLAALAVEAGCEWVTTDQDYSRFVELRWRSPLA